ncbi:MAG: putative ferric reductase [Nocardia sp.]|uniref:ferric reductase-like transmembrane domain-containing protein n=1 Tax=Nocardia sp. TaxID=1821 RepID=UPI00262FB695|nr:ferric reductase-like transmembrane domain-containing protein [Nocardia sp.]MCU1645711.1 putative ferric reductase [Nocardia sp.]
MGQTGIDQALWAFGRGTGIIALILLTVSVALGVAARSGRAVLLPRAGLAEFHRGAALTAAVLVVIHVSSLLIDPYAQLRLLDVLVPFAGQRRAIWLGLGTVAVDLLVAITVTALLRHRLGPNVFRMVHYAAYALWPIAFAHALGTGTDAGRPWMLLIAAACLLTVIAAVIWRLGREFDVYHRIPERSFR